MGQQLPLTATRYFLQEIDKPQDAESDDQFVSDDSGRAWPHIPALVNALISALQDYTATKNLDNVPPSKQTAGKPDDEKMHSATHQVT